MYDTAALISDITDMINDNASIVVTVILLLAALRFVIAFFFRAVNVMFQGW